VLRAGLHWLRETTPSWDVLELGWTSEAQLLHVEEAFREAGLPAHIATSAPVSEVDLGSGWESYWSSRTSKHRNNVSRAGKKLSKLGRVTCLHHGGDADPRWDLYDLCEGIASQSWQGASTTGNTLSHDRVRDFLRELHEIASVRRRVDMHVLLLDGQPAAFAYNYVINHSVYALRMGYVPQLAPAGPGLHLIREVLREAARLGHTRIDLGEGDARYKHYWRTGAVQTYRVCHYRRHNLLAQALRLKRHWFS
jgi:CelD/BcsL family acetyltransferase involved in cellulose biosynthesis